MPSLHRFERSLAEAWPPESWRDVTVLVAVSGGADSVALLRAAVAIQEPGPGRIVVAHYNHRLRGDDSDRDERLVRDLSARLGLVCELGRHEDAALSEPETNNSAVDSPFAMSEQTARDARYSFLTSVARRLGARWIATAHTADDLVETVLHRILRGTGLKGLVGIPRCREFLPGVSLLRPMLGMRRAEVVEYLRCLEQPFREDGSNADVRFTRNRIRHELLPLLAKEFNPHVFDALTRLSALADGAQQIVDVATESLGEQCVQHESAGRIVVDCTVLSNVSPHLVRELLAAIWKRQQWPQQAMSFDKWEELALLAAGGGSESLQRHLPGGIIARRQGDRLTLLAALDTDAS